jgi:hypothetical protein
MTILAIAIGNYIGFSLLDYYSRTNPKKIKHKENIVITLLIAITQLLMFHIYKKT